MQKKNSSIKQKPSAAGKGVAKRGKRGRGSIARNQEMAGLTEYIEYLQNRRRLLSTNFFAGMMRGIGFAVGFSILGAFVVMLVQKLALANLPGIGDFFAEVVRIVQMKLY